MESLIVCRHAESEFNIRGVINGDPSNAGGLSSSGRDQARSLGAALAARSIDLCVTTEFDRTIETADIALAGRSVPRLVMPELSDSPLGTFELRPLDEFLEWRRKHGPDVALPGTDVSERAWLVRVHEGLGALPERPETTILAILHGMCVSWLLGSAGLPDGAPHAEPYELSRADLFAALASTRADVYARWRPAVDADRDSATDT